MAKEKTEKKKGMSKEKELEFLELALIRYKDGYDADKTEITYANKDVEFAHNEDNCQWDPKIKEQRQASNPPRPCLSLNKIPEKIDQVEGEFRQLKPSYKIRPVDSLGDPKVADIYGGLIRQIEFISSAQVAYNTSHNSALHCGRGAWKIDIIDCDEDPFVKDIEINRITNCLSIVVDPDSKKMDRSDADWQFIIDEISKAAFESKYGDIEYEDLRKWAGDNKNCVGWINKKAIRIAEYWYKVKSKETYHRVNRQVNGVLTEVTIKDSQKQKSDKIIKTKEIEVPKVKWCKMVAGKILEGPFDWPSKYIPIIHQTGKEIFIKGQSKKRGMVRHAITPQMMYNYWSSTSTEQIALQPKSPYMVTQAMISNYKTVWDMANVNNYFYLPYDADPQMAGVTPKREAPPMLSSAMASERARMEHDIMSAMGIYEASLGDSGPERSGKAIFAQQKKGTVGSYVFTDNFGHSLTHSTKVLIDLIPSVYDTERILRIRGEDNKEFTVPINARPKAPFMGDYKDQKYAPGSTGYVNDLSLGKYDAAVSIGLSYSTQREELAAVLGEIIKSMPPAVGGALITPFLNTIDMPNAEKVIEEIQNALKNDQLTFDQQLKLKEMELKGLEEMRKGFESKIDSIAKLMMAEAQERGQQLDEMVAVVNALAERYKMEGVNSNPQEGM